MEIIDTKEKILFRDEFMPQKLRVTDQYKVPLICMNAGQEIPPHPSGPGIFYIISGKAVMTVNNEEQTVSEGNLIFIEDGDLRGIRAIEKTVAFAVRI